jgi:hypothetical protein
MSRLVEFSVILARFTAIALRRNYDFFTIPLQSLEHSLISIVAFIGQEDLGLKLCQEDIGTVQIAGLPRRQMERERIAESVR